MKALVAFHAMELCRDLGLVDIIFEGDSAVFVIAVAAMDTNRSQYGQIVDDIKYALCIRSWAICHVHGKANFAAHGLVKKAATQNRKYLIAYLIVSL
jgi:hypothetical protein